MEYDYKEFSKRENRVVYVLALVTFLAGIALFYASDLVSYAALWQAVGILLLAISIWFLARGMVRYLYCIEPDARGVEGMDLHIFQMRGKRQVSVCRLGLNDLREMDEETSANRKQIKQKYHDTVMHNYCPDILPKRAIVLRFDDGGDMVVIRVQASDTLSAIFRHAMTNDR